MMKEGNFSVKCALIINSISKIMLLNRGKIVQKTGICLENRYWGWPRLHSSWLAFMGNLEIYLLGKLKLRLF